MTEKTIVVDEFEIEERPQPIKTKRKVNAATVLKELSTFGFHNLHATDKKDGEGDGLWWPLDSKKRTRHIDDPVMSLAQAKAMGIKIGKG